MPLLCEDHSNLASFFPQGLYSHMEVWGLVNLSHELQELFHNMLLPKKRGRHGDMPGQCCTRLPAEMKTNEMSLAESKAITMNICKAATMVSRIE